MDRCAASGSTGGSLNLPKGETFVGRVRDVSTEFQRQNASLGSVHSSRFDSSLEQGHVLGVEAMAANQTDMVSELWGLYSNGRGRHSAGHCVVGLEPELWEELEGEAQSAGEVQDGLRSRKGFLKGGLN